MQWPVWHWKLLASHVWWPTRDKQRGIKDLEKLVGQGVSSQTTALNSFNLKCHDSNCNTQLVNFIEQIYIFTTLNIHSTVYKNNYIKDRIVCVTVPVSVTKDNVLFFSKDSVSAVTDLGTLCFLVVSSSPVQSASSDQSLQSLSPSQRQASRIQTPRAHVNSPGPHWWDSDNAYII